MKNKTPRALGGRPAPAGVGTPLGIAICLGVFASIKADLRLRSWLRARARPRMEFGFNIFGILRALQSQLAINFKLHLPNKRAGGVWFEIGLWP